MGSPSSRPKARFQIPAFVFIGLMVGGEAKPRVAGGPPAAPTVARSSREGRVHNLEVTQTHTYIVTGKRCVVHNTSQAPPEPLVEAMAVLRSLSRQTRQRNRLGTDEGLNKFWITPEVPEQIGAVLEGLKEADAPAWSIDLAEKALTEANLPWGARRPGRVAELLYEIEFGLSRSMLLEYSRDTEEQLRSWLRSGGEPPDVTTLEEELDQTIRLALEYFSLEDSPDHNYLRSKTNAKDRAESIAGLRRISRALGRVEDLTTREARALMEHAQWLLARLNYGVEYGDLSFPDGLKGSPLVEPQLGKQPMPFNVRLDTRYAKDWIYEEGVRGHPPDRVASVDVEGYAFVDQSSGGRTRHIVIEQGPEDWMARRELAAKLVDLGTQRQPAGGQAGDKRSPSANDRTIVSLRLPGDGGLVDIAEGTPTSGGAPQIAFGNEWQGLRQTLAQALRGLGDATPATTVGATNSAGERTDAEATSGLPEEAPAAGATGARRRGGSKRKYPKLSTEQARQYLREGKALLPSFEQRNAYLMKVFQRPTLSSVTHAIHRMGLTIDGEDKVKEP